MTDHPQPPLFGSSKYSPIQRGWERFNAWVLETSKGPEGVEADTVRACSEHLIPLLAEHPEMLQAVYGAGYINAVVDLQHIARQLNLNVVAELVAILLEEEGEEEEESPESPVATAETTPAATATTASLGDQPTPPKPWTYQDQRSFGSYDCRRCGKSIRIGQYVSETRPFSLGFIHAGEDACQVKPETKED